VLVHAPHGDEMSTAPPHHRTTSPIPSQTAVAFRASFALYRVGDDGAASTDGPGWERTMRWVVTIAGIALAAATGLGGPAAADQWDQATDSDNGPGTDNAPFHGSEQVHDLAALPGPLADQDWYLVTMHELSSYEFVVDGLTGDMNFVPDDALQLLAAGGTVLDTAEADGTGVLSMAWMRGPSLPPIVTAFVRVRGAGCLASCDELDRYRARFYETTYTIPRFNNSGTQATAILIQNATNRACTVRPFFLTSDGQLTGDSIPSPISPRGLLILPPNVPLSGSVRIAHTCGYGGLSGKAVSVEPSTGFTFDTPMLPRPR